MQEIKGKFRNYTDCESAVLLCGGSEDRISQYWLRLNSNSNKQNWINPKKPAKGNWSKSDLEKCCARAKKPDVLRFIVKREYWGNARIIFDDDSDDRIDYRAESDVSKSKYILVGLTPLTRSTYQGLMRLVSKNQRVNELLVSGHKIILEKLREGKDLTNSELRHVSKSAVGHGLSWCVRQIDNVQKYVDRIEERIDDGLVFWIVNKDAFWLPKKERYYNFGVVDLKEYDISSTQCLTYADGKLKPLKFRN